MAGGPDVPPNEGRSSDAKAQAYIRTSPDGQHLRLQVFFSGEAQYLWRSTGGGTAQMMWDLEFDGIFSWYGQSQLEWGAHLVGVLQWDTYIHRARVAGRIRGPQGAAKPVGGDAVRGYGDSNWGVQMLHPPPGATDWSNYPWGWYVAGARLEGTGEEVSLCAGVGRTYVDPVTGVLQAKFLDVRVGGRVALEAVFVAAEKYGFRGGLSNHGGLGRHHVDAFDVARAAWSEVAGTSLPLQQNLTVSGGFGSSGPTSRPRRAATCSSRSPSRTGPTSWTSSASAPRLKRCCARAPGPTSPQPWAARASSPSRRTSAASSSASGAGPTPSPRPPAGSRNAPGGRRGKPTGQTDIHVHVHVTRKFHDF